MSNMRKLLIAALGVAMFPLPALATVWSGERESDPSATLRPDSSRAMRRLTIAGVVLFCVAVIWCSTGHGSPGALRAASSSPAAAATNQSPGAVEQTAAGERKAEVSGASGRPLYDSPFEASLLTRGKPNDRALKALEARNFEELMSRLDAGLETSLGTTYRRELEDTLSPFGSKLQLDRLSCGANVCLGSVRSASDDAFADWYEHVRAGVASPMGPLAEFRRGLGDGVIEHRILFTTNPRSADFLTGPAPDPSPAG